MQLQILVPALQAAVSPVILISGAGLLMLSITNRFGRVIDRSRQIAAARRNAGATDDDRLHVQADILYRRARLLRASITLATISILAAATLVILLFLAVLADLPVAAASAALFVVCLLCLVASLLYFLRDINLSLVALKVELHSHKTPAP